jgi:hypothetical protein
MHEGSGMDPPTGMHTYLALLNAVAWSDTWAIDSISTAS